MSATTIRRCRSCQVKLPKTVYDFGTIPLGRLVNNRQDAVNAPTVAMDLLECENCGLVQLANPINPELLYVNGSSLPSSAKVAQHEAFLAEWIVGKANMQRRNPVVLEVGCNDGRFLSRIGKLVPHAKLVGIDSAKVPFSVPGAVRYGRLFDDDAVRDFLIQHGPCDMFIARHCLEHVPDVWKFVNLASQVVAPGAYVCIEVPDFGETVWHYDYSALWEEHCNYFDAPSLAHAIGGMGVFDPNFLNFDFSGGALVLLGHVGHGDRNEHFDDLAGFVRNRLAGPFGVRQMWNRKDRFKKRWLDATSTNPVVYGAGCRAATLINLFGVGGIRGLCDDSWLKIGGMLPVSGGGAVEVFNAGAVESQEWWLSVNEQAPKVAEKIQNRVGDSVVYSINPPSGDIPGWWRTIAEADPDQLLLDFLRQRDG